MDDKTKTIDQVSSKFFYLEVKDLVQDANSVKKILPFQIIVAQWLQIHSLDQLCIFPWENTFLIALFVIASSLGGLLGGGTIYLSSKFREDNSCSSSASAIPLAALLLLGLPDDSIHSTHPHMV